MFDISNNDFRPSPDPTSARALAALSPRRTECECFEGEPGMVAQPDQGGPGDGPYLAIDFADLERRRAHAAAVLFALQTALAESYAAGGSLRAVALANGTSVKAVRKALCVTGTKMRPAVRPGLLPGQRQALLDDDAAGVPHRVIAQRLNITSERVRQIARAAGRPRLRGRRVAA